jgi:D-sedoheptulose 7-phosphate isomerase
MSENFFIHNYLEDFSNLVKPNQEIIKKIVDVKKIFLRIKKNKKKIIIFGNGGSAAIASHVSVDLTKNSKIRCVNFNEADLITCFSNDFGYEHWIEKAIEYYGDKGDAVIFISSSGKSKNILK